jgi:glycosyltransferase involved in cell wall biosynthesis
MTGLHSLSARVAVLLPTYNGIRFVEAQLRSLKENDTPFVLHWLDDHSTDNTREIVRSLSMHSNIELREWHQSAHQGVPGAFFRLLECVDADIYLFCDQDDVWQPGKIDATVANLLPDMSSPALCFSDPLMFRDDEPGVLRRFSTVMGARVAVALQESRLFMPILGPGNTQGFTRPLRDIFVRHADIARTYALGHDLWMYLIAVASGKARMLFDAPTTLYRRHGNNFTEVLLAPRGNRIMWTWQLQQMLRRVVSRQAQGFLLASATLPPGPRLERFLTLAKLVATLDRRQSLAEIARLARRGAMWPSRRWAVQFAIACLCSDARLYETFDMWAGAAPHSHSARPQSMKS